ncbi:MAG TPA: SRPBCC family protein [Acidobacteriaceae bacterium]|nr:SRPBCC family protein [Acidobacteriaceae bacterium]
MHLEQSIVIKRGPEEVWKFLGSVENIAKWDRGVERAATTREQQGNPVGLAFDTFVDASGSDRGRMSYRIGEVGENYCTVQLTSSTGNARFFRKASWTFRTLPHPDGTLLVCAADFETRLRYCFLASLLYLKRSAIAIDLECLKQSIEGCERAPASLR